MRVGLVGAGFMGGVHAKAWRQAGAELVAVVSARLEEAAALAQAWGARPVARYEELLELVDVVDLCVPTHLHAPMALEAIRAGRHVVCEKPIALRVEDGQAMIEAARRAGVRLFVAMVLRFFPQYRAAREIVKSGQIGSPGVIRLKRVSYCPQKAPDNWYLDEARSGGMMVDLMVHDFDYARWLAGDVRRVYARAAGDRYALVTLEFASGAMALVEGGWAYPPGIFRTALDVAGSEGLIEWSSDTSLTIHTYLASDGQGPAAVGLPLSPLAEDPFTAELKHVLQALRTGEPFDPAPEDALEALRIALAARESARTGRPVRLA